MSVLRWSRAELNGTAQGKLRWSRAALDGTAAVLLAPMQPQTVEPGTTVTLAPVLLGWTGTVDSWTWRQISGPTVTRINSWANVAFVAPSTMPPGTTLVFGAKVTVGGTLSPEVTVTITVLPQLSYLYIGGAFTGSRPAPVVVNMPTVEDVPGFTLDAWQDFTTPVAEGGVYPVTSGSDLGILHASSAAAIAGYATGPGAFKVKADGAIPAQTNSFYSAIRTISISGGSARIRLHYEAGVGYGGGIKPIPPSNPISQTYGIWRYRMRHLASTGNGWGGVADLINSNTWGAGTGEFGVPENNFDAGGSIGAFIRPSDHITDPNRSGTGYPFRRNAVSFGGPSDLNGWHTWTIQAAPGRTQIHCDGYRIWDDPVTPIADALSLVWQYGKAGSPATDTEATVEIDWYTISKWTG